MVRDAQGRVSVFRDGTALSNPEAVSKFRLRDGQLIAVFFSVPAECLFSLQLTKTRSGSVPKNKRERLGLLPQNDDLRII